MTDPDLNCVCAREQSIALPEGGTLHVHRTELTRKDLVSFVILVEVSGETEVVNRGLENPQFLRGIKVACCYDGTEATAKLELWTTHEFTFPSGRSIFHFVCSTIESADATGEHFEFILPFVDFGQGDRPTRVNFPNGGIWQPFDHLAFNIGSGEWTLRNLYEIDHVLYTTKEAAARKMENPKLSELVLKPSAHSLLQAPAGVGAEEAESTATRICWLLHLAFAQPVAWSEMRVRAEGKSRFVLRRSFAFPSKVAASSPLRNWGDRTLKLYLEGAYPEFEVAETWWSETMNWYSIATEHLALESSSMIFCMLLDRMSSKLLNGHTYAKQIGDDLDRFLEDESNQKKLAGTFGGIMKPLSSGWEDYRSNEMVKILKGWNDSPSYGKKISIAFGLVGLKEPSRKMLGHRHKLMHEGGLKLKGEEAVNFLLDLNEQILVLLFAMLNYRGKFFLTGRGARFMADFALDEAS